MEYRPIVRYGVLLTLILMTYFLTTNLIGISGNTIVGWLGYLPYILVIFFGLTNNKSLYENYRAKFLFGLLTCVIGAVAGSVFMYAYLEYVDDMMIRTVIENQIMNLDKAQADYELIVSKIKTAITPAFYLIFGIISGLVIGAIFSAVMPILIKKMEHSKA